MEDIHFTFVSRTRVQRRPPFKTPYPMVGCPISSAAIHAAPQPGPAPSLHRAPFERVAGFYRALPNAGREPLLALGCGAVGTGVAGGLLFPRTDIP